MKNGQTKKQTFALSQEQVDFLRQAPVVWDPSESGAPIVDPESLHKSGIKGVHNALQVVLRFSSIEPGKYTIENRIKDLLAETEITANAQGDKIAIPQTEVIEFELTEQHIKLLRHANSQALTYFGACGLNACRPYGELSAWQLDVAHTLGMPVYRDQNGSPSFSAEEMAKFLKLHHEMLLALPVFLAHARIEPAEFVSIPSVCPAWERVTHQRHTGSRQSHRVLRVEGKQLRLRGNW